MPRRPRVLYPGATYHLTTRGARQLQVFCCGGDAHTFFDVFADVVRRFRWTCHAFCLIPNHYHLLVTTPEPNLSAGMQRLNWYLAVRFNARHRYRGHAFDTRYGATLVEREAHLLETCRYIVLNPIRAGLVSSPEEWPWSSYSATCGDVPAPDFLTVDWILSQFRKDEAEARAAYREFVREGMSQLVTTGAWHLPGTGGKKGP